MSRFDRKLLVTILLPLCSPALAQAQVAAAHDAPAVGMANSPAPAPFGGALQDDDLQAIAGREDTTQLARADQAAGVTDNSVGDHVRTGDASIADNAFQNMSGLSILNVNTGNNVAINAAMNVNISVSPAP